MLPASLSCQESPFLTEREATAYLKITKRRLDIYESEGFITRHPHLRLYAKVQVESLARHILSEMGVNVEPVPTHYSPLGPCKPTVGSIPPPPRRPILGPVKKAGSSREN